MRTFQLHNIYMENFFYSNVLPLQPWLTELQIHLNSTTKIILWRYSFKKKSFEFSQGEGHPKILTFSQLTNILWKLKLGKLECHREIILIYVSTLIFFSVAHCGKFNVALEFLSLFRIQGWQNFLVKNQRYRLF